MDKYGWTGYELAEKAGLNSPTIYSLLKRDSNPTLKTISAIADAFGITLSDFFKIEQNKNCYNLLTDKYNLLDNSSKEVINFLIEKIIK